MSAQKQQPQKATRQMLEGFRSAHSRLVDSQQQHSQGLPEQQYESVPSVTSELLMLLTPTNRMSSGPFQTPEKDEVLVRHHSREEAFNDKQTQQGNFAGRMTYPDQHHRPLFGSNVNATNIRMGRVVQAEREPSIEQAVNITHLMEVNQLLKSQNSNLQQNNYLLRMLLAEKERQLQESGQLQLKQELDELKDLVHKLQIEKMQQLMQSHTSESYSDADVSISLMEKHMKELKEDLNGQSQRLKDKERQAIILQECLREEKNINDRLLHRIRDLEDRQGLNQQYDNGNQQPFRVHQDGNNIVNRQQQQQTVVKQPHQPSLLMMRGRRSYSVSSHQQSESQLPLPQKKLGRQKSKMQLTRKDSERVFGYYTKELGKLTAENDRLNLEHGSLNQTMNELRITIVRLEEQRNAYQRQIESVKRESEMHSREGERRTHILTEQSDRLKAEVRRLQSDVRQKTAQLDKREQSLTYYIKLSENAHQSRARTVELECALQRLKLEGEQGQRSNLGVPSSKEVQELWRLKNNSYAAVQKQMNNFRELNKLAHNS